MKKPTFQEIRPLREFDRRYLDGGAKVLVGIDEAGRGPLAGPVVASAVIVNDPEFAETIDDSKKLSALQRERAWPEILRKCVVSIAVVDETRIDEINIYRASLEAMAQAYRSLERKADKVLVDGNTPLEIDADVEPVVDGDAKSLSIACASIVAKVFRDRVMRTYHTRYPKYGFFRHKGYGTPEHLAALNQYGPCPIHRRSFAPVAVASRQSPVAGDDAGFGRPDVRGPRFTPGATRSVTRDSRLATGDLP